MEFHDYFLIFWICMAIGFAVTALKQQHGKQYYYDLCKQLREQIYNMERKPYDFVLLDMHNLEEYYCKTEHERGNVIKAISNKFISIRGHDLYLTLSDNLDQDRKSLRSTGKLEDIIPD